jgi:PPM family protein phosphatase
MNQIAISSRTGIGARSRNEDFFLHGALQNGAYAVLADGAGGHGNGHVAAHVVVRESVAEITRQAERQPLPELDKVASMANHVLNQKQIGATGQRRMHSTLVMLWIDQTSQRAVWTHVGDSRLYLLRQGRVMKVTRDDSLVQQMVDVGLITPQEARHHSQRNQLVAAMGIEEPLSPHLSDPQFVTKDGDAFLLCSDGWYDQLDALDIEYALSHATTVDEWLDAMQALVLKRQTPHQDNFTAVAVWVGNPAEITRIAPL